jgi:hypothetical protein
MKTKLFLTLLAAAMSLVMLAGLASPVLAGLAPQKWNLDSTGGTGGTHIMEKVKSLPSDPTQTGFVLIPAGQKVVWIADQKAQANVTFAAGAGWELEIVTDKLWNTAAWTSVATTCEMEIGYFDGTFHKFASVNESMPRFYYDAGGGLVLTLHPQTAAETVETNKYLAVQIWNKETIEHTIWTGEDNKSSCLTSPSTDPGYPVPEAATAILLGLGVTGIGVFIITRRKSVTSRG